MLRRLNPLSQAGAFGVTRFFNYSMSTFLPMIYRFDTVSFHRRRFTHQMPSQFVTGFRGDLRDPGWVFNHGIMPRYPSRPSYTISGVPNPQSRVCFSHQFPVA